MGGEDNAARSLVEQDEASHNDKRMNSAVQNNGLDKPGPVEDANFRRRFDLRKANEAALARGSNLTSKSLDSNLKKNTAFIKKSKLSIGSEARESLLKDIETLSLERYISEIAFAVLEGALRLKTLVDLAAASEVISALHQRFPKAFTPLFAALLYRALQPPNINAPEAANSEAIEREETSRILRQRVLIKLAGELYLVKVLGTVGEAQNENAFDIAALPDDDQSLSRRALNKSSKNIKATNGDESFIYGVLRDLLIVDKYHDSITILIAFVKAFRNYYLTDQARSPKDLDHEQESQGQHLHPFVPAEQQVKLYRLCSQYHETAIRHLTKDHAEIKKQEAKNHEAYIKSGIVFEDRQNKHENFVKSFEKLQTSIQALSELLDLDLPTLKDQQAAGAPGKSIISSGATGLSLSEGLASKAQGPFGEDEETRKFYEDLPDLRDSVPSLCLDTKGRGPESTGESVGSKKDELVTEDAIDDKREAHITGGSAESSENKEAPMIEMSAGSAANLDALFLKMSESNSTERIDQDAVTFAKLNSKAARKRLVKHLTSIAKSRLDLLPYYARFVAILHPYTPDVTAAVLAFLEEEYRYGQRKKIPELNSLRSKTLRYLAELVKFRLVPEHTTFHILRSFLDDLTGINIESLCVFLENCGRFLLYNTETAARMSASLEILLRKKQVQNLEVRYQMMLENAYYQVNPPERPSIAQKKRSVMEVFIRKLVYTDLSKRTQDNVLRQLRMLPWQNVEVRESLYKVFGKIWKVKFSTIPQVAALVSDLCRNHNDFGTVVVDQVLEDIQIELEQNIFKHNQRRIASIRYFGELFNWRLVEPFLLFHVLWQFVTFGHDQNVPHPDRPSRIDSRDDFFRVRVICTLIETCSLYFERSTGKKKLEEFISFFQVYLLAKEPLSMDVTITIEDTLENLPFKIRRADTYEAAWTAYESTYLKSEANGLFSPVRSHNSDYDSPDEMIDLVEDPLDEDEGLGNRSLDESRSNVARPAEVSDEDNESTTSGSESSSFSSSSSSSSSGDDKDDAQSQLEHDEENFARELGRLMTSGQSFRRQVQGNLRNLADLTLPRRSAPLDHSDDATRSDINTDRSSAVSDNTSFTLISRRGNKQALQDLSIPTASSLARAAREARERERTEQQELKRFVLSYEERGQEYSSAGTTQSAATGHTSMGRNRNDGIFPAPGARRGGTLDQALKETG